MAKNRTFTLTRANARQIADAIQWGNTLPGGTIKVQMDGSWNEKLAKAAIDIAKSLWLPKSKVVLFSGPRNMVVGEGHSIRDIRQRLMS
jgi:hypothetical protein